MPPNERKRRMLAKYRRVTTDRLGMLTPSVEGLQTGAGAEQQIAGIKRELHTLKGEARLMSLETISKVAHEIEELFVQAIDSDTLAAHRDRVIEGLDLIAKLVDEPDPFVASETREVIDFFAAIADSAKEDEKPQSGNGQGGNGQSAHPVAITVDSSLPPPPPSSRASRRAAIVEKLRVSVATRGAAIRKGLDEFERSPENQDLAKTLKREVHTIKGDTRIMSFAEASEVAAKTEAHISELLQTGRSGALRPAIETGLALIQELVQLEPPYSKQLLGKVDDYLGSGSPEAEQGYGNGVRTDQSFVNIDTAHLTALTGVAGDLLVRHEQVDRSIADVERITMTMLQNLSAVVRAGRDIEVSQGSMSRRRDLVPRLNALGRELLSTVARAKDEQFESRLFLSSLQSEIREVRMVRVGDLFMRHARAARELAKEQGKRVQVVLEGSSVTVDKQVLDHLEEPLLHLIRNAVDHAMEPTDERLRAGKRERGELKMTAREAGGHVEIRIEDDGRGIDPERIRQAALERGLLGPKELDKLDRARLLALLFRPGFSTREQADELSGRGVGLDVVNTELGELGGSVKVESELGRGTEFVLRCPISVAFARGLVIKTSEEFYALPSTAVVEVLNLKPSDVEQVGLNRAISYHGQRIPLVALSDLLGVPSYAKKDELKVVIVQGDNLLAVQVDAIVGEREAVRKNLNEFLEGVTLITGTATVEGRRLVMFLHLPELFRAADGTLDSGGPSAARAPVTVKGRQRILVVDDSELTRDMLVSLLERLNYIVEEAVDGADALQAIAKAPPDLVLTDLDMPVMDGFALVYKIRSNPRMQDLPVVVFSTRGSDSDKRRAMEAGANGYLVKSAFRAQELHRAIQRYLQEGFKR